MLATANTGKTGRVLGGKHAGERTRRAQTSKEEIPGSKRSIHGYNYTDLLQALRGERLSAAFSLDGTLISASAAPHCGAPKEDILVVQ